MKPRAINDWSNFLRLKIEDGPGGKRWQRIDGKWQPWLTAADTGRWEYVAKKGQMVLTPATKDSRSLILDNLNWDFQRICLETDLTGSGLATPAATNILWVLGAGNPIRKKRKEKDYPWDPPIPPVPVPRFPHTRFKIRILKGASPSMSFVQKDEYDLEVVDETDGKSIKLHYLGVGAALPNDPTIPTQILGAQPFTNFNTTQDVSLSDFVGSAQMFTDPGAGQLRLSIESDSLALRAARITGKSAPGGVIELPVVSHRKATPMSHGAATKGELK
jgi:hypothetical protein